MKKVIFLTVCHYRSGHQSFNLTFDDLSQKTVILASLSHYDTGNLRRLDVTNNKIGRFFSYSAGEFIGNKDRDFFEETNYQINPFLK